MSWVAVALIAGWAGLLMVWVLRLPIDKLYASSDKVLGWLMARVLLRFGVGVFGVLGWEALERPQPPALIAVVVDRDCPEAWLRAQAAASRWLSAGYRVGLVVAGPARAFWAIPPTVDTVLWHKLFSACLEVVQTRTEKPAYAAARRTLEPYRDRLLAVLWVGRWEASPLVWPACGASPSPGQPQIVTLETLPLPSTWPAWGIYALLFFVCGGLLLGMEVTLYLTGKHLPLRQAA